jgi:hypothetical protein
MDNTRYTPLNVDGAFGVYTTLFEPEHATNNRPVESCVTVYGLVHVSPSNISVVTVYAFDPEATLGAVYWVT